MIKISKECSICKISYPLESFSKRKDSKDGYQYFCRFCKSEYDAKRIGSRSGRSESGKWKKDNPEKHRAHSKVHRAIKSGKLVKNKECFFCANKATDAHHEDYNKSLDVKWICKSCHRKLHNGSLFSSQCAYG